MSWKSQKRTISRFKEETLDFNESGLDFLAVFVEDNTGTEWVLRIPRRDDVMPRTKVEKQALDIVSHHTNSFQTPDWVIYTEELTAYKKLDGVPAGTLDHNISNYVWEIDIDNIPETFNKSLGKVLAELHSIPNSKVKGTGLTIHTPEEARLEMKKRKDNVKDKFGVADDIWNRFQRWISDDAMWPKKTALTHGDVHAGHTMIDDDANVIGLIDWTEAKVSDVSSDFIFNYKAFGEEGLDDLIQAYKEAGGYHWPKMKEHILELNAAEGLAIAEFAIISGLEEYEQMAKEVLGVAEEEKY